MPEALRVSASKVGLLERCGYFARPEAEWAESTSAAADRGTRFHAAIAEYIETGIMPEAGDDVAPLLVHAQAWVDAFGREKLGAELAFAWDPVADRAEVIGQNIGREYAAGGARLCGSADVVAVNRERLAGFIGDWATGDGSRKGPQLRTLAVMLARAEGLETITVQSLEVDASGVRVVVNETLDSFDLAAIAGGLAEAIAAIPTAEPVPGLHCAELWCPARASCPVGRAIVAEIAPPDALTPHRWSVQVEGPEHAAWLLDRAKLVEAAAKAVRDAVKAACPEDGWAMPDGSRLTETYREVPRFDKGKALALLRELGATDEQIEQCTYRYRESGGLRLLGGATKPRRRYLPAAR